MRPSEKPQERMDVCHPDVKKKYICGILSQHMTIAESYMRLP